VVKRTCILLLLLLAARWPASAQGVAADLAILNANIITVNEKQPRAEALAVKFDRFLTVGANAEIQALVGKHTRVIDARGKTITPGFIDAHMHPTPIYPAASELSSVDLGPASARTIAELIAALKERARVTPKGQWIFGRRYQDTKLGRHPTRWDLDQASTEHPIRIGHSSGHLSVVSSLVLQAAGITKDTPDPPGGAFDRDPSGEPNGVCRERAAGAAVNRAKFPEPARTRGDELQGILRCFRTFLSKGITSVGDAGVSPSKLRLHQDALAAGQPVRVYAMIRQQYLAEAKKLNLRTGFGSDRLRIGSIKMGHGNSLSGRTCWLYETYADRPDYYGIPPARSQEELDKHIFEIHEAGFQAAVHSNGDREIDMVLEAFEKALARLPRPNHRHRIEHCSVVNPGILQRIKKLGLVLALHSYIWEHGDKMEAYGAKRWGMMHPNRSALDLRIPVAGNSDWGVSAADPLLRIQDLVSRKSAEGKVYGPEQRISAEEAIRVFTLGGAYASFEEEIKGSIEAGKLADFVILSADPTKSAPDATRRIHVDKTFVGGRIEYDAGAPPAATASR